jgi:hypothetical protein
VGSVASNIEFEASVEASTEAFRRARIASEDVPPLSEIQEPANQKTAAVKLDTPFKNSSCILPNPYFSETNTTSFDTLLVHQISSEWFDEKDMEENIENLNDDSPIDGNFFETFLLAA